MSLLYIHLLRDIRCLKGFCFSDAEKFAKMKTSMLAVLKEERIDQSILNKDVRIWEHNENIFAYFNFV